MDVDIAIVGSGFAGLGAAVRLSEAGRTDLLASPTATASATASASARRSRTWSGTGSAGPSGSPTARWCTRAW
jgi:glycine/D-amino acid oxidase-like deaminating enzyme